MGCLVSLAGLALLLVAITPYSLPRSTNSIQDVETLPESYSSIRFSEKATRQKPVYAGEISHGSVAVENVGNKVIADVAVMSNCWCSEINLSKTTIGPGESTQVDFSIDTKGRDGDFLNTFVLRYSEDSQSRYGVFYVTVPVSPRPESTD